MVVGGPMSVPDDLLAQLKAKRISGRDRYETSKAFYDEYNKDRPWPYQRIVVFDLQS